MVSVDLTVHGVRIDVKGDNLEGIGMHEERVALREVDSHRTVRCHGITRILIILAVVSSQLVLIDGVYIYHITEGLTEFLLTVIVDTVAN